MAGTRLAQVKGGLLEPLETLGLPDGKEGLTTISGIRRLDDDLFIGVPARDELGVLEHIQHRLRNEGGMAMEKTHKSAITTGASGASGALRRDDSHTMASWWCTLCRQRRQSGSSRRRHL